MEESNGENGITERLVRVSDSDADKVDDDKKERDQRSVDDVESVNTIVADTHTVKKDDSDPLQIQSGNKEWPKGEHLRILPSGSRASAAQIHLPFKSRSISEYKGCMEDKDNDGIHSEVRRENDAAIDQESEVEVILDCRASEGTDIKESESQRRNLKDRSANIDDPTRGASNLGDCATYINNTVPSHLQDHDDKSGKSNRDKIILDNIYIDDCSFSATTEDELREIKAILPDVLHANGLIAKATICKNKRNPLELSSSGFINTTSILEKAEHSRIDNTDGDNDEYIKDDHFSNNAPMSIEKDREKSKHQ